ncbi:UDP-N-acetylglucosamine diphosphorylase/glucosamine-1-phosphate N-acetyltransferase [Candidatus Izimaplasma bacterium ZiA1]|uniref:bifunctional UDP-N-acetylglucosamine diphosphorylase/glucosamine-1-phosphate N-acetyltransferase GlmU n=1 Tax=Candidatus Izimoplasma sp. ZiA1 TaxID=2024899 RepID=UPI000BAA65BD|nr:UDP-N-acetylglucosamine diphosphorylase/glucosamine-1-phosphate N-acetyltransferase [Candidatus Izimaplasma bacterium ZiA1]
MKKYAVVLAAGKGTRMKTELPKCAFPILKKPMIEYITENIEKSNVDEIITVVGHKKEVFFDLLQDRVEYAVQEEQLGTGHAVLVTKDLLERRRGTTIILLGDMPLVDYKVINKVISYHTDRGNDLTVVTTSMENPKGYGRIIRNEYGNIEGIVEHINCTKEQKQIKEINTGIYVVSNSLLFKALEKIEKNPTKGEYYLTDIVEIMKKDYVVGTFVLRDSYKVMGVNDLFNISIAEKHLREQINKMHMLNGVSIINPETVTIGHNVLIEENVTINPNTTITGDSVIKTKAVIGPNTEIHSSTIYESVEVRHSLVYDSTVHENTTIGPFAHLRNGANIGANNRIGNFVEVKKSSTGDGTKAAHLAYIGDTVTGKNVNFGCGSITVNYDGINKHQTIIGDDVFIGCNTNLVAPLSVGDKVFIAAGSTVTKDIPKGALAIARNKQINKADYAKNLIKPKDDQ